MKIAQYIIFKGMGNNTDLMLYLCIDTIDLIKLRFLGRCFIIPTT